MAEALRELEGTWEEILEHSSELAGHRVHVRVLPPETQNGARESSIEAKNRAMKALLEEWNKSPLTEEERAVLDEMEAFNREHRFTLRQVEDEI